MSDDWRLRVQLTDDGVARALTERLAAEQLSQDLGAEFGDRLAVSHDGPEVFVYAGDRAEAERAADAIRSLATEHEWEVELELKRWHPTSEEWEDPDKPLPETDTERRAEHQQVIAREREETRIRGYAEYEVRIECRSHRDTVELAERLRAEKLPVVRRWKYLLVGAPDEDTANKLAKRLRDEAPDSSTVTAEASLRASYDDDPTRNSFAVFGGLGG
jgi:hypothetical protein